MDGWIKLHREIMEHRMWKNIIEYRLFTYLVMKAHYSDEPLKIADVEIRRGQFLRSYRQIQTDLSYIENNALKEYSLSTLKRTVEKLKEEISTYETKLGTLFTVVNYEKFQDTQNTDGTPTEHQQNNKKKDKNITSPSEKAQSAQHPVWGDAVDLLVANGEKEASARAFLGRALKEYEEGAVNDAISACILQQPVNPKAFLIACLQTKPKKKAVRGTQISGSRILAAHERQGGSGPL